MGAEALRFNTSGTQNAATGYQALYLNTTGVRYEAVNARLLNEFLKEHRAVEELKAMAAKQQKDFQATAARQQKQIETLTAGLQQVNERAALQQEARRMAAYHP
jgi:predicted ribosome quality control (RQC) complex YloA/Tae2 family protein